VEIAPAQTNLQYPFPANGLALPSLPKTDAGVAVKLWSDPLPTKEGWATLRANHGEFKMRWDTTLLPQVAVWMNFGAWA
jgi:hypothetical protein